MPDKMFLEVAVEMEPGRDLSVAPSILTHAWPPSHPSPYPPFSVS